MTSDGNNLNDFLDNQLTKFRVFIGGSRIFLTPLKFLYSIALRPPIGWTPLTNRTNIQTYVFFVQLCLRWSLIPNNKINSKQTSLKTVSKLFRFSFISLCEQFYSHVFSQLTAKPRRHFFVSPCRIFVKRRRPSKKSWTLEHRAVYWH